MIIETETVVVDGHEFVINYMQDTATSIRDQDDAIDRIIRESCRPDRHDGEQRLRTRSGYLYFNRNVARRIADEERWGGENPVQDYFEFVSAYFREDWFYVGIEITSTANTRYKDSLWGVETYKDYHHAQAREMATDLIDQMDHDAATLSKAWDSVANGIAIAKAAMRTTCDTLHAQGLTMPHPVMTDLGTALTLITNINGSQIK